MGLMTSWTYLRFYQKHTNKTTGDSADHFMFASFFPEPISPVVGIVANTIFSLLVRMKICKRQVHRYNMAAPSGSITVSLPGTNAEDAERRRQIALKVGWLLFVGIEMLLPYVVAERHMFTEENSAIKVNFDCGRVDSLWF